MSLFRELKRRNVFRVAILYVLAAWLLLQITDVAISLLELPGWVGRFVFLLVALGAIPALLISWLYEMTPDGLKREHAVADGDRITQQTGRRIDLLIGIFGAVIVTVIVADRLIPETSTTPATTAGTAFLSADKSIAVLPFADMSAAGDHEYFGDGIAEELLDLLAKIPELRVISRTSSFQFKGQSADVRTIAQTLAVATILEGSVRKSGDRVRVTAQLVRGDDGSHLWSESYDRDLDDVFDVQDDIAGAVVRALRVELLGELRPATGRTVSGEAHALYLQGRHLADRSTTQDLEKSIEFLQQALQLDPDYATAWAMLSRAYLHLHGAGLAKSDSLLKKGRDAALRAVELDPNLPDGHLALVNIYIFEDWDWPRAQAAIDRAARLEPGSADILRQRGTLAVVLGQLDESVAFYKESVERDPLRSATCLNLGLALISAGRYEEAADAFRRKQLLDEASSRAYTGLALLLAGQPEQGLELIKQEPDEVWRMIYLPLAYHAVGQKQESDAALQKLIDTYGRVALYQVAENYAYRGDVDEAIEWLNKAYEARDGGLIDVGHDPLLANLHGDPRYHTMLRKMNLAN
jgi:TolB-like protein/Tfp pilus assembly protein PilF